MEIATNAVLIAMLVEVSKFVTNVGIPLQTPLETSNVVAFRVSVSWNQARSDLGCYFAYKGGYEFVLQHGFLGSFDSRDSYLYLQRPEELPLLAGEVKHSESECLGKVRQVFRNLGYTNIQFLNADPEVEGPIALDKLIIPRFIFRWRRPESPKFSDAEVEVNASRLTIETLTLVNRAFWREPWPITFGTTNTLQQALGEPHPPPKPKPTELQVRDVSREYAKAYIAAVLPQVSDFCSKLAPPFPAHVSIDDIDMADSEVAVKLGRVTASLRLKCGYLLVFTAGHIWAVHAADANYTSPWWREEVRQSKEYNEPTRFSGEELAEKVRGLLLDHLGFPERPLFLDLQPEFSLRPNPSATNGIRRYVFQWQHPETEKEREERMRNRVMADASVSAEVDAVSGEIKTLNFFSKSLERPDPKIDVPMNSANARKDDAPAAPVH